MVIFFYLCTPLRKEGTKIEGIVLEERVVEKREKKKFYFFLQKLKSFLPLQPGSEGTKTEIGSVVWKRVVEKGKKKKVLFFLAGTKKFPTFAARFGRSDKRG